MKTPKPHHHHWPGEPSTTDAVKDILQRRLEWEREQAGLPREDHEQESD